VQLRLGERQANGCSANEHQANGRWTTRADSANRTATANKNATQP